LFASNDVATLKALLIASIIVGRKGTFCRKASLAAAAKHLPAEYAGMIFLRSAALVEN
jgi:hypothetical protein